MTTRAFVLVDAIPGREEDVASALPGLPVVKAFRRLPRKYKNFEFAVVVEGANGDAIERLVVRELRSVGGVGLLEIVRNLAELDPWMRGELSALERGVKPA